MPHSERVNMTLPHKISSPEYPIIYIRGYAATMSEIEDTVSTPYMGFNLGSTKLRQNHEGAVIPFVFESPLIRLMKDHGYQDTYQNGQMLDDLPNEDDGLVSARSVWIFRYYESVSESLGDGERRTIPEFADELREFILKVRSRVCGDNKQAIKKFRVYLVAHSMGGLVCRCYLQNICVHGAAKEAAKRKGTTRAARNKQLELQNLANRRKKDPEAVHLVDKVFTYATPHNGIDIAGTNAPDFGSFDGLHVRNFNRKVMADYLCLPASWKKKGRVTSLNNAFPPERFFCFIGSNHQDYNAFMRLSQKGTGPMSDGLVMIKNASVDGAPRAMAHRSHSGHYGIVNSEEGYQNLRRFLFGDVRVHVLLNCQKITLPESIQKLKDSGKTIRASYNIETQANVRGAVYKLNERRADQNSAILRSYDRLVQAKKSEYLFSGFLSRNLRATAPTEDDNNELVFVIRVSIDTPVFEVDRKFWFDDHLDGVTFLDATITLKVSFDDNGARVRYDLQQASNGSVVKDRPATVKKMRGYSQIRVPLGQAAEGQNGGRQSFAGELLVNAKPWNV